MTIKTISQLPNMTGSTEQTLSSYIEMSVPTDATA